MKTSMSTKDQEGTPFQKFDRLFRAVVAVPKAAVEKEEAKERLKNRTRRARKKAAKTALKKKGTG